MGDALDDLIARAFAVSPDVRYVAAYLGGVLRSRSKDGLAGASSSESDRYEELIVNPTLLTLVKQRGDIDCGGVRFVVVRYGSFFQAVVPMSGGHLSVAFEPTANPPSIVFPLRELADAWEKERAR